MWDSIENAVWTQTVYHLVREKKNKKLPTQWDHMLPPTSIRDTYYWDTSGESREPWPNIPLDQTLLPSLWSKPDPRWSWNHPVWKHSQGLASYLLEVGICSTGHSAWRAREMQQSWVSWRSVHWCQPSALAAFCTRKSKQTPKHRTARGDVGTPAAAGWPAIAR